MLRRGGSWGAVLLLWSSWGVGGEIDPLADRLVTLAASVAEAGEVERFEFTFLALSELIHDYEEMLQRSYQRPVRSADDQRRLYRWRGATTTFVRTLKQALEALEMGALPLIDATSTGQVVLHVGGIPTVVESPNLAASTTLAERIVGGYCTRFYCGDLLRSLDEEAGDEEGGEGWSVREPGAERRTLAGFWSFAWNRGPRYYSDDGLIFEFDNPDDREQKQRAAEQLVREMRILAQGLRNALHTGHLIDWAYLVVVPGEDDLGTQVILDQEGNFLRMQLPLLAHIRLLSPELLTWLHGQVRGHQVVVELREVEELLQLSKYGE